MVYFLYDRGYPYQYRDDRQRTGYRAVEEVDEVAVRLYHRDDKVPFKQIAEDYGEQHRRYREVVFFHYVTYQSEDKHYADAEEAVVNRKSSDDAEYEDDGEHYERRYTKYMAEGFY